MKKNGFTLIEILIVVIIIGILFTIAVMSSIGFSKRANEKLYAERVEYVLTAARQLGQASTDDFVEGSCQYLDEPVADAKCFQTTIQNLVDKKYLRDEDIVDPRDKSSMADTPIEVQYYYGRVYAVVFSDEIMSDGTITINNGVATTISRDVTIQLSFNITDLTDAEMCLSNTSTCTEWQSYQQLIAWELTPEAGTKTVSVWFKDRLGNQSNVARDSIIFDPVASIGTLTLNNGDLFTGTRNIELSISMNVSETGVTSMCISNGNTCTTWQTYDTTVPWTLTENDGNKTVRIWFRAEDGDQFADLSGSIYLDLIPPAGGPTPISINGGATYTSSRNVTLNLSAADISSGMGEMCISNTDTCNTWIAYNTSVPWQLDDEDGNKTVKVWFRDNVGNISIVYSDDIILDRVAPNNNAITINNDDEYTKVTPINLILASNDATSGLGFMCISQTVACSMWVPYATTSSLTLNDPDGTKRVYVMYRDLAGNTSVQINDSIILDREAPINNTITINGGDEYADSANVTLTLSSTDLTSGLDLMCISENTTCADWIPYATTYNMVLSGIDGIKTVYVSYIDKAGNVTSQYSDIIILDRVAPVATTIIINGGVSYTSVINVNLTLEGSDGTTGVNQMCISQSTTCSTWIPYATSHNMNLTATDGTRTVYVIFRDLAGNTSNQINDSIILDRVAPTGNSVTINGGASYTNSVNATLSLASNDATSGVGFMCVSQTVACSIWVPYSPTYNISLTGLDGTKTVYVTYRDRAGNTGPQVTDTIVLDRVAPTGTITINGGATYSTSPNVTLSFTNIDVVSGVNEMCISNTTTCSTWEAYSATKAWALTATNGTKMVYVNFRDRAGNVSIRYGSTIVLDTVLPTGAITINSAALYTSSPNVTLNLLSNDATSGVNEMCISNTTTCSVWETYSTVKNWVLTATNGTKIVYSWFRDRAGNVSARYDSTIILDTVVPTGSIVINGGATYATSTSATLTLNAVDVTAGVNEMCISQTTTCSSWIPFAGTYSIGLTATNGTKTVYAWFRDRAGNQSIRYSDTIILDTVIPTGTIVINSGDAYTNSTSATLTLSANDITSGITQMCISQTTICTTWIAYAPTYNISLTASDGNRSVYVKYLDAAGHESAQVNDSIILDRVAPASGTISINGGAAETSVPNVSLTISSSDGTSGLSQMCVSQTTTCTTWIAYATTHNLVLTGSDGTKTVYVRFQDNAGNISSQINDTIVMDTTAPSGTVTINSGADYTNSLNASLSLLSSDETTGVTFMCISQTEACSLWIPYATTHNITLTATDGTRTVYAKFRDTVGHESEQVSDTIVLDRVNPINGTIVINGGADYTNSTSATLTLSSSDALSGLSQMCISQTTTCSSWEAYSGTRNITLSATDGTRTVYVKYRDRAGNESTQISDTIVLDRVNPTNGTIVINGGATYTNSRNVTLALSSSDALSGMGSMCISNTTSCSTWESYSTTKSWTLTTGDGVKTVYVQYRDQAGNISAQINDTINFDGTPPTSNSIIINSGAIYATTTSGTLTLTSSDPTGGIMMCISQTVACSIWVPLSSPYGITLNSINGVKYVYAMFRDLAGNQTSQINDTIILDTVDPVCTNSGDSTTWTTSNRTINWGCTDATSGCNPTYSGGNTIFSVTTQTAVIPSYVIRDNAGREVTCPARTANVYVDKILPVCGSWSPSVSPWKSSGGQTFVLSNSTDAHSGINVAGGSCVTGAADGDTCSITISDNANNTRLCTSPQNRVDGTAPSVPTLTVSEAWTSAASVNGSISGSTDFESGILRYEYSMSGATTLGWTSGSSFSVTNSGQTTVTVRAINGAGIPSGTTAKTVRIDRTAPSVPTLTVSEAWTNAANVAGTISGGADAESGISGYQYSMSGATTLGWTSGSVFSVSNEGQTTVTVRAVNNANVVSGTTSKIVKIDRTNPSISEAYFGAMFYTDPNFSSGLNNVGVYNNAPGTGTVTHTRTAISTPVGSYVIRINSSGTPSPGLGGFHQVTLSRANATFIHRIIARIPVGYSIQRASNALGDAPQIYWITPRDGTGDWEEYIYIVKTSSTGTFSTFGHVYLTGTAPVTWDLAYATIIDTQRMGVNADIIFLSSDAASGINGYGINQSSVTPPSFTTITPTSSFGKVMPGYTVNGTYYIWTRDSSGNVSNRSIIINNIDTTGPSAPTLTVSEAWTSAASVTGTISGGSDAESGIASYQYSMSGATTLGWTNGSSFSVINAGQTTVTVRAINGVGLAGSTTSKTVKIDRTASSVPTLTVSEAWSRVNVSGTISGGSDLESGIDYYQYSMSGATTLGWTNGSSFTVSTNGETTVTVRAINGSGLASGTTAKIVKKEVTPPTCGTWSPSISPWKSSGSQSFTLSNSTDTGGSLINTEGGSCTTGTAHGNTCTVTINDHATNSTTCTSPINRVDTTAPSVPTLNVSEAWTRATVSGTISGGSDTESGIAYYQYSMSGATTLGWTNGASFSVTANGLTTVTVRAINGAGLASGTTSKVVKKEVTPPTCGTWSPSISPWKSSGSQSFTLSNSTDTGGSLINTEGGSCTTGTAYGNTCTVTINDHATNSTTCTSPINRVDTTAPSVPTLNVSEAWTNVASVSGTISGGSDSESGIAYYQYSMSGATSLGWTNGSSFSVANAGLTTVTVRAVNGSGLVSPTTSKVVRIDRVLPTCTNSGDSTSWASSRIIYWGCSDGASGCNSSYNGGSSSYTTTTTTSTIGAYTIRDNAGNQRSCAARTASIYVDRTPPSCTNSGDSSVWTSGNRIIYWGCSDGHSGCNTSYNGGSTTFTNSVRDATIASYTIRDWVGNSTTCPARTASVYVDKTSPWCQWTHGSWSNPTTATITGYDNFGSGVSQISNGTGYISGSVTTRSFSATGTHTGYVRDAVGNTGSCQITISSRTEYSSRNCLSCARCSSAGCYSYSSWVTQSSTRTVGCSAFTSTYYRYTCTLISTNYSTCYYGYGISSPCYTRAYQTRYCVTYNQSCPTCGCASWNAWSAYTTTYCSATAYLQCQTRTTYY